MSLVKLTHIYCDRCGEAFGVDMSMHRNGGQQREAAKQQGWTYLLGRDYCPIHDPKIKNDAKTLNTPNNE